LRAKRTRVRVKQLRRTNDLEHVRDVKARDIASGNDGEQRRAGAAEGAA